MYRAQEDECILQEALYTRRNEEDLPSSCTRTEHVLLAQEKDVLLAQEEQMFFWHKKTILARLPLGWQGIHFQEVVHPPFELATLGEAIMQNLQDSRDHRGLQGDGGQAAQMCFKN